MGYPAPVHLGELLRDDGIDDEARREAGREEWLGLARLLAAVAAAAPGDWAELATCRGHDTRIFFPEKGAPVDHAKALCAACPVIEECAAWGDALTAPPQFGIYAGESGDRRRRRLRRAA